MGDPYHLFTHLDKAGSASISSSASFLSALVTLVLRQDGVPKKWKNSMPYISLGQNKFEAIFSYPRLFLPLDKYSKIPLQLQKIAIGTQNTSIGTPKK
jgi:hypothetical protein